MGFVFGLEGKGGEKRSSRGCGRVAEFACHLSGVIRNPGFVLACAAGIPNLAGIPNVARSSRRGLGDMASLLRIAVSGCSAPIFGNVLPPKVYSAKTPCLRVFRTYRTLTSQAAPKPGESIKLL